MSDDQNDRDYVNSLARGLEVIRSFSRNRPRMTVSEVANATDLTRATVRRCLLTLVKEDYAATDGKYFRLLPRVLELGYSALSSMSVVEAAQPMMANVSARLDESCSAAMLDRDEIVYVARSVSTRVVNIAASIGGRLPAHCTSMGRILLADLSKAELDSFLKRVKPVRQTELTITSRAKLREAIESAGKQGWALVDGELELGLCSISVPVRYRSGRIAMALGVGSPTGRVSPETMRDEFVPVLIEAAQSISSAIPE